MQKKLSLSKTNSFLFIFTLIASNAYAATFVVDRTDDSAAATTCDTGTANDCSLRGAIITANATGGDDIITLPSGIYSLTIAGTGEDAAATGDLDITSNITINGAGNDVTEIDGNSLDRVFHIIGTPTVDINNLFLYSGQAPTGVASDGDNGGGILIDNGTVTLTRLLIGSNFAGTGDDGTAANGFNGGCGGGIAMANGTVTIDESSIGNNDAGVGGSGDTGLDGGNGGAGGGICQLGGTLTITASTISSNDAGAGGEGSSTGNGGDGGGLSASAGTATLNNVTFAQNIAGPNAIGLSFGGNGGNGGGIAVSGTADVTLNNATLALNSSGTSLLGTTGEGGGVYISAGTLTLSNSIIGDNFAATGANNADCDGSITSAGFNLLEDATGCTGLTDGVNDDEVGSDPDFETGLLQDNGGQTATFSLSETSPALNTGDNATCETTDQRGETRLLTIADACDKGAYELAICGNSVVQESETCDDGNIDNTDTCTNTCDVATCGDGFVHAGTEDCDDAGESATCDADCSTADCGDGIINTTAGEECDDADSDDTDACTSTCEDAVCGDSFVENGVEDCDDGNTTDGDGCSSACADEEEATATCGNGVIEGDEECDDSGESERCNSDCTLSICGDGIFNATAGEECEESGEDSICIDCNSIECGDGVTEDEETCDDGNTVSGDGCSDACQEEEETAECGNGLVEGDEVCDDGNQNNVDSCNNACSDYGSPTCTLAVNASPTNDRTPHLLAITLLTLALKTILARRRAPE